MKRFPPYSPTIPMAFAAFSLCACAAEPPPRATSTPRSRGASEARQPETSSRDADDGESSSIVVDERIAQLCAMPTAHFSFDRSNINDSASTALDVLATCLSTGALKGRPLTIVGHADPRGGTPYNHALGRRRAESVGTYLVGRGVLESQLTTSSRGEVDATGVDVDTWAKDRKVEIMLADSGDAR